MINNASRNRTIVGFGKIKAVYHTDILVALLTEDTLFIAHDITTCDTDNTVKWFLRKMKVEKDVPVYVSRKGLLLRFNAIVATIK